MNVAAYFETLASELDSLKDRVRQLISDHHWLSDGEWKETVLRSVLRRHLPASIKIGRGFVIKPDSPSKQIDVLIYDSSMPTLFLDGDIVMVTPDAVRGIIEIKTKIYNVSDFTAKAQTLADNADFILSAYPSQFRDLPQKIFVGIFSYETDLKQHDHQELLSALQTLAQHNPHKVINHAAFGQSQFIRFWETDPSSELPSTGYNQWHSYYLKNKAAGYFVNNVVDSVASNSVSLNPTVWFPIEGKENKLVAQAAL
ncbi:MAG: hypothetical protein HOP19_23205 [Acidobacteria bacterium]|nr:hypothetical protein [Acidobacteriota bacterium]